MSDRVLDFFNRPVSTGDYVVGTGRTKGSGLSVGKVVGFTPTGMITVIAFHNWSAGYPSKSRIKRSRDCMVINPDLIPKPVLFKINTHKDVVNL